MRSILLLSFILLAIWSSSAQSHAEGLPFKEYTRFEDVQSELFRNNDTTYVINFWATWCAPCIREMPYFQKLHQETADQAVEILLVSLDMKRDLDTKLTRYLTNNPLGPRILALTDTDANAWIPRVSSDWDGAIPATLIRRGDQVRFFEGEFDSYDSLRELLHNVQNLFD